MTTWIIERVRLNTQFVPQIYVANETNGMKPKFTYDRKEAAVFQSVGDALTRMQILGINAVDWMITKQE